jgi:hypothetical protein
LNSDVFTQQGELGNEEDMGTAGNTKWTISGKSQRLAKCHVNVATSP